MRRASASRVTTPPSTSTSARAPAGAQTRWGRTSSSFRHRVTRFPPVRASSSDSDGPPSDPTSLPDLTRPGLTPWDVLGMDNTSPSFSPTVADARRAFKKQLLLYHPDVFVGDENDATENTKILIKAFQVVVDEQTVGDVDSTSSYSSLKSKQDPFSFPETSADAVFVNPFQCRGKSCPTYCCCVATAPEAFEWNEQTAKARFMEKARTWSELSVAVDDADVDKMAYQLNCAVQQCPVSAIFWVTPEQRKFLEQVEKKAVDDWGLGVSMDETTPGFIYELLQKAQFENGRAGQPARREPKRSSEWVAWY